MNNCSVPIVNACHLSVSECFLNQEQTDWMTSIVVRIITIVSFVVQLVHIKVLNPSSRLNIYDRDKHLSIKHNRVVWGTSLLFLISKKHI